MCAAVAGAIAAGVTAAASVGGTIMSATKSSGGGGGAATQQMLRGFAPATGLQSYTARMLAMNAGARPPTFDEWVGSGGTKQFDMTIPGFTPMEARQLRMVGDTGEKIPTFDPQHEDRLSNEELAWLGNKRKRDRILEPHGEDWARTPEEKIADLYNTQQRLLKRQAAGNLGEKGTKRLGRIDNKIERVRENPSASAEPSPSSGEDNSTGARFGRIFGTAPWDEGRK